MSVTRPTGRPVTLHVDRIDFDPEWGVLARERYGDVDLELNREHAKALVQELLRRLDRADISNVRVRFTGRVVH